MEFIKRCLFQLNPYHLLVNSPWPFFESFSLYCLTQSAVLYMHGYSNAGYYLTLGFILTAYCMALWFRDMITESTFQGAHTKQVVKGIEIGILLFIVSEAFAFLSIFWAYFHSALSPTVEIGGCWPPQGIQALSAFSVPLINTVLLVTSGAFVTYAHHSIIKGNRKRTIEGNLITILIAIIFTCFQCFEYIQAPFTISDSVFGSAFFASTGLHGLHVIVGTIFILVGFFRIVNYHLSTNHHVGFEASILYWHFVDVVWLFLFIAVYYWGGN